MSSFPTPLSPSPVHLAFTGIQWDPLAKLKLSQPDISLLRSGEDNPLEYTLADRHDAAAYARLLLKVLDQVVQSSSSPQSRVAQCPLDQVLPDDDAVQMLYVDSMGVVTHYAITKLYEIILALQTSKTSTIQTTFYTDGMLLEDWRPLLRILHKQAGDAFSQRGSAFCLAHILLAGCPSQTSGTFDWTVVEEPLNALVSWVTSRLQSSSSVSTSLAVVTPTLTVLTSCVEARLLFDKAGGIGFLARRLRVKKTSVQQLYELCFCLWTMTYECSNHEKIREHFHRDGAVHALVDLVAAAPREKVVRVALAALRNLATSDGTFLTEMIGCGLIKSIDLMKERQWTDPDILDDLTVLHGLLHENFKEMTRWDVYVSEVQSGHLEWGILHTEKFFRENAKKMEGKDGDFFLLKTLIKLVQGPDEDVAAVACYDIGEFVRNYPNGRAIARRLGAKNIIIKMIEHDNPELQRNALLCVSKMMVINWEAVR